MEKKRTSKHSDFLNSVMPHHDEHIEEPIRKGLVRCPIDDKTYNKEYHCNDRVCVTCPERTLSKKTEAKQKKSAPKVKTRAPINLTTLYPYQTFKDGHLFILGMLAYPALKDIRHVVNFITSVRSEYSKALLEAGYPHRKKIADRYLTMEKRKAIRNIQHFFIKRLPRRARALGIANRRMSKLSASAREKATAQGWLSDAANVTNLIWNETKPVLHLAFALIPMTLESFLDDKPELTIERMRRFKDDPPKELCLHDLLVLSHNLRKKHGINTDVDLIIKDTWLDDVLTIAETWGVILPALIPSIKKQDLFILR